MPPTAISDKGLSADWCLIKRSDRSSLKDIVRVQNYREYIIEYIAIRLTLTKQEAAKHSDLQDEYLAQGKEYRFRVTQRLSCSAFKSLIQIRCQDAGVRTWGFTNTQFEC